MSDNSIVPFQEVQALSRAFYQSGYFKDATSEAQAIVKVMFGQELGFGPAAAMSGIYIIQGKPSLSANLMAAAVKRSGKYDYRVTVMEDKEVSIEFFQRVGDEMESIGISRFTEADAKRAGTKNTDKFPRNMLFARAMSNGVKWFCPDIFTGAAVYEPGELGASVNYETGEIIDMPTITTTPRDDNEKQNNPNLLQWWGDEKPEKPELDGIVRPWSSSTTRAALRFKAYAQFTQHGDKMASDGKRGATIASLNTLMDGDEGRKALLQAVFDTDTSKTLTDQQCNALLGWADSREAKQEAMNLTPDLWWGDDEAPPEDEDIPI
jgi:hypothetical protein